MSGGSDDKSRKTEKPTNHKLKELRKKGQVPKSKEIVSTAVIMAMFAYMWIGWHHMLDLLKELFLDAWGLTNLSFDVAMVMLSDHLLMVFLAIVGPAIFISIISVILSSLAQFGFIFSVDPVTPDINKINPVSGFKKIFGAKNLVETAKSIIKIVMLAATIYMVMKINIPELMEVIYCDIECAHTMARRMVMYVSLVAILLLLALSIFDWWFQNYQHVKDNMMTREELKRDHKSTEGDPMIKGQRKSLQQEEMKKGGIGERVKEATAVIVSGRFAIGMMYEQGKTPLPLITFMEKEQIAIQIVQEAEKSETPIFEEDELVRELWIKAKVDQFMPTLSQERVNEVAKIIVQAMRAKMAG